MKRDILTVRVESDLKKQYQQVIELMGISASDHIRKHMQETVQKFMQPAQGQQTPKPPTPSHRPNNKRKRR